MSDIDVISGVLRLSKGAWLFAPDGADLLLRVQPQPAPATEGFLSQSVQARLIVRGALGASGDAAISPRTGVPEHVHGRVVGQVAAGTVVDAGIAIVVAGLGAVDAGSVVNVDVDVDSGVDCILV